MHAAPLAQTAPVVKTNRGSVEGTVADGISVFKGIPFAAPPVGELRWREPQDAAAWQGVRKADAFSKACMQNPDAAELGGQPNPGPISEDCLYLNVWTPTTGVSTTVKRPVMVWIYGGAFVIGAATLPGYDGVPLAKKGAVVVSFNYRLGALGFFAHPALEKENPAGPVNFGLFDQVAALKWVQKNIAAFGGDPNNVTIFGESAGAQSVLSLFASPMARGLFHKGIAESIYGIPEFTRAQAIQTGVNVASAVGLKGATATAEELRALPAERFAKVEGVGTSLAPVAVVGDAVLPQSILDTFGKGQEAPVPLIIGSNSDEATVATGFGINPAALIKQLGVARVAVKALYPGVKDDGQLGSDLIRDLVFVAPARKLATLHSKHAPAWRYYFSHVPIGLQKEWAGGVPHGGEIPFVFSTLNLEAAWQGKINDADRELSRRVTDYWFEFARTGAPASTGGPAWPKHDARNDKLMEFGDTAAMRTNFSRTRLSLFDALYPKVLALVFARK